MASHYKMLKIEKYGWTCNLICKYVPKIVGVRSKMQTFISTYATKLAIITHKTGLFQLWPNKDVVFWVMSNENEQSWKTYSKFQLGS